MLTGILRRFMPVQWWMKRSWESRARKNAAHYVADFRERWDNMDEFFASGQQDVEKFLAPAGWGDTSYGSLLEIGCGIGRMTRHFASRFRQVVGVDISPTMIEKAKQLNGGLRNVEFQVGSGVDLKEFRDNSVDYIVSYIVFQHIPSADVIYGYIREALRVLRPDGRFRFQARNDVAHGSPDTYNGASIELDQVAILAERAGRRVISVTGTGTQYCYIEIG